jgi:20S proteasome subunit beta 3
VCYDLLSVFRFGNFFCEPVIAGLQKIPSFPGSSESTDPTPRYRPFIAGTDVIGCLNYAKDFIVNGSASSKLFGVAEGLWEPDLVSLQ